MVMPQKSKPTIFHIPVCPFSQRLEILLALKGKREAYDFEVIDITVPRPDWLLAKTGGATALPVMETEDGTVLRESLVLLQYLEDRLPERPVAQPDPLRRAIESLLVATTERDFVATGYQFVMNQDPARREEFRERLWKHYAAIDAFLMRYAPNRTFLFEDFGWAEVVFTPMFMRFWFLDYYEDFELPGDRFARVRAWRDACLAHPAAQQVTREQIVKCYYDYAKGAGNGGLLPGRSRSSFALEPHWSKRPMPPKDKYGRSATDAELGL
ncbi:MAG: glutathione S-transferase family protein [Myxococcales bacterium]|nr:glutathione S-transferase family protein [Myxococcales bacterium]